MSNPSADQPPHSSDPSLQIQQKTKGNSNQIIGQVLGGMVVYGQVIYNNPVVEKSEAVEIGPNPYKGLLAFHETDGDRFFGRDPQIQELWEKFRGLHEDESATRLLTIYGPSGSGKSSLARAGLVPALAKRPLPGCDRARVAVLVPGSHPLEALATVLARVATEDATPVAKTREFAAELKEANSEGIYDGLRRIADALPEIASKPLIVVVDQLEEVFTLCEDATEREAFVGNLLCATSERSKRVSAIVILRSDFIGETKKYPALNEFIKPQGYSVKPMTSENLREAIAEPARLAGSSIDQGSINRLIEQTEGREGALPLLQYALKKIWEEMRKGNNPEKTLEMIGGVGGGLAEGAKRVYKNLSPKDEILSKDQLIARQVFLGLVHLGEGTKDTRRRIAVSRLVSHQNSSKQVLKVIAKFADERLITLAEDDKGERTAEVSHEALFENWQQLEEWIGDRINLRFQRRLEAASIVWNDHGKPNTNLWQSPDLDLLRKYQDKFGDDMTTLQMDFFNTSIDHETAKRLELENTAKNQKKQKRIIISILSFTFGVFVFAGNAIYLNQRQVQLNEILLKEKDELYNKYAYCPEKKGRPGEKVEGADTCFRALRTSGDLPVFLSRTNYNIEQGTQAFRKKEYERAKSFFNQAAMSEPDDPVPKIFFNNASARLLNQKSHKPIVKLAVVTSVDYFETGARQVLTGVAHAQDNFNCYNKDKRECSNLFNIEIEINNDENDPKAAQNVADTLVNDKTIKGVIGHYASESTIAAQEVYDKKSTPSVDVMPVISPTSASSKIGGSQFFRAVGSTKKGAKEYVDYLLENNINASKMLVIFYNSKAEYSKTLKNDFMTEFKKRIKSDEINLIDIGFSENKYIDNEINKILHPNSKIRAVFIFTDVKTNAVAMSIIKKIKNHKNHKKYPFKPESVKIFGAMSLLEKESLKDGSKDIDGMIMVRPCMSKTFGFNPWKNLASSPQPAPDMDWRTATSYDTTKAFGEAIKLSKNNGSREEILRQLRSPSFELTKEETSGIKLKWDLKGDRSNEERKYCPVQVKKGKFVPIESALPTQAQSTQPQ